MPLNFGVRLQEKGHDEVNIKRAGLLALKIFASLLIGTVVLLLLACGSFVGIHYFQMHQMEMRAEHWNAELKLHASPGSTFDETKAFFASQKAELACTNPTPNTLRCAARDPQSFGLLPSWRFYFTLNFADGKLIKVHTERLGIGL